MSFDYEKLKKKVESGGSEWTSYSDLFMTMSVVFLLLYVIANVRAGSMSLVSQMDMQQAKERIQELEDQLRSYEVVQEQAREDLSKKQQVVYENLINQMALLEEKARAEKEDALAKFQEQKAKEDGLNRYQRIVKSLIQANLVASQKLRKKDAIIESREKSLAATRKIVKAKQAELEKNNLAIRSVKAKLRDSMIAVQEAFQSNEMTKKKYVEEMTRLRAQSEEAVRSLETKNAQVRNQLDTAESTVAQKSKELVALAQQAQSKERELRSAQEALVAKDAEVKKLEEEREIATAELERQQEEYETAMERLADDQAAKLKAERAAFEERQAKLTAAERLKTEEAYRKKLEKDRKEYDSRMQRLAAQLDGTKKEIQRVAEKSSEAIADLESRQSERIARLESQKSEALARLESQKSEALARLESQKSEALKRLESQKSEAIARLESQRSEEIARLESQRSEEIARLESQKSKALAQLESQKSKAIAQLESRNADTAARLAKAQNLVAEKDKELAAQGQRLKSLEKERDTILGDLERKSQAYARSMSELEGEYKARLEGQRKSHDASLAQEKLSGEGRLAKERAYRAQIEGEKAEYDAKMKALAGQLAGTQKQISAQEAKYKNSLRGLASTNQELEKQLIEAQKRANARQELASRIKENFKAAGVDADVNQKTGEVTIHFGQNYFKTGRSDLTDGMREVLRKAMPAYAKSIFEDDELAKRVSNIEIVGFASPTFRGKYIDPKDLSESAQSAVNFNLDLSYKRASNIFREVFNQRSMKYKHQDQLLSLTKVAGKGYLGAEMADSSGKRMTFREYCEKYDCAKSQKVIIKFNFQDLSHELDLGSIGK